VTVAILGAGKIGEALLAGLVRTGLPPAELRFSEKVEQRAATLSERYGVAAVTPRDAAAADVLVLAVKPPEIPALLDEICDVLPPTALVLSVAAGVSTATMEARLPTGTPVVRVMPNTPLLVNEGMSAISAGSAAGGQHLDRAEGLLTPFGRVVRVPESQLDAVTALSGGGPAYFFLVAEAMIDAGVLLGLSRAVATELVVQTAVGSAAMLRDSGDEPAQLRAAVTSPGGTTIAALRELENHKVRAAFFAALEAARNRARELDAG
jgi:pyrroline-5-carboxylate reductase